MESVPAVLADMCGMETAETELDADMYGLAGSGGGTDDDVIEIDDGPEVVAAGYVADGYPDTCDDQLLCGWNPEPGRIAN